ncbi:MAG: hypothetical protein V1676_05625 [Candidatus Diapherotrites archaeon]
MAEGTGKEGIGEAILNFFRSLRRTKIRGKKQQDAEAPGGELAEEIAPEEKKAGRGKAAPGKAAGGWEERGETAEKTAGSGEAKAREGETAGMGPEEKKMLEKELSEWRSKVDALTKKVENLEERLKSNTISPNQAVSGIQVVYGEVDREENSINREMRATKAVMKGTVFDYYKRRMTLDEFRKRMLEYRGRLRVLQVEKAELKKEGSKIREMGGTVKQFALQMPANATVVPGGSAEMDAVFGKGGGGGKGKIIGVIGGGGGEQSGGGAAPGGSGNSAGGGIGGAVEGVVSGVVGAGYAAASALKGGKKSDAGSRAALAGAERAEREARASAGKAVAGKGAKGPKGARAFAVNVSGRDEGGAGKAAKPALPRMPNGKGEREGADAGGGEEVDKDALEERWGGAAGVKEILEAKAGGKIDSERLAELEKKINALLKAHKISESDLGEKAGEMDTSKVIESFNKLIDLVELEKRAKRAGVLQEPTNTLEVSAVGLGSPKKVEALKGIAIDLKKHRIVTDFDRVLSLIKEKKKMGLIEVAATLGIDKKWAEECCEILEQSGLVEIVYPPFGKAGVRLSGYVEEKKPKKK